MIAPQPAAGRVTTLELFFDLVCVFTITQLTTVLVTDPTALAQLAALVVVLVAGLIAEQIQVAKGVRSRGSAPSR